MLEYITQPPLLDLDNVLMEYNEPSKFHPTFSLPSPQWHTLLLPLFKYERTAFGFSTHYSSFLPDCLLLALCFHLLFFLYDGDFEPRGECTLAKYIDSTLSVYAIESLSVVVVATNIHKTCFTIKMWSLFVRIKRLRYSSSLLHSFEYPRVENRTSVDCGKLFNKRLPSKHVNVRNWGAMSQQNRNNIIHCIYIRMVVSKRFRNLEIL